MTKTNANNLGYLGLNFQYQLIKCFFEDARFFSSINHIVDQNMFTEDSLRRIVGYMKDRYNDCNTVATYFDIETMIRTKVTDNTTLSIILSTLDSIRTMPAEGIDLVEEESEKFFKQQNLTKAINQSMEIIKKGNATDYYIIEDLIKKALETNSKEDFGFRIFDYIDADLADDYRETISTGCKELDESLYGGLGKGELGLIVSPMGVGKTSITVGLAAAAATQQCEANNFNGFKVLHYFVEDEPSAIRRKYMGYVLDTDACDLSVGDNAEITKRRLAEEEHYLPMIQRNILAKRLINGETTASEIRNMIRSNIAAGFKPDLVIVDYFECLKAERGTSIGDSEWTREGLTMRKLESICNEYHVAMWVPVQGTKGSVGQEFVGIQHAGGSVTKTQIGHVVLTLARTDEQKSQSRLNVYLQKFRAARIGRDKFLNVKFNNGTGKFDMSDLTSDRDVDFDNPNATNMVVAGQLRNGQRRT